MALVWLQSQMDSIDMARQRQFVCHDTAAMLTFVYWLYFGTFFSYPLRLAICGKVNVKTGPAENVLGTLLAFVASESKMDRVDMLIEKRSNVKFGLAVSTSERTLKNNVRVLVIVGAITVFSYFLHGAVLSTFCYI